MTQAKLSHEIQQRNTAMSEEMEGQAHQCRTPPTTPFLWLSVAAISRVVSCLGVFRACFLDAQGNSSNEVNFPSMQRGIDGLE